MKTGLRLLLAGALMLAAGAAAEPLGRLFFTPEQRSLLDRSRREGADVPAPAALRLDGVAQRSGRRLATWINGRAHDEDGSDAVAGLRVGEALDPVTRRKTDVLPDGSITRPGAR